MRKHLSIIGLGLACGLFISGLVAAMPLAASAHDMRWAQDQTSHTTQVSYTQQSQHYTHWSLSTYLRYTVNNATQKITVSAHTQASYTSWTKTYFHYTQRTTVHPWYSNNHRSVHYTQTTQVSYTAWTKSYTHLQASASVHYTYWTPGTHGHHGTQVNATLNAKVSYTNQTQTYLHYTRTSTQRLTAQPVKHSQHK